MEQGTHNELIRKPEGAYAVLVGLQMSALGKKSEDDDSEEVVDEDEELVSQFWASGPWTCFELPEMLPDVVKSSSCCPGCW